MHGELGERAELLGALALVTQNTDSLRLIGRETVVQLRHPAPGRLVASGPVGRKEAVGAEKS
jgi:hypothetical protein